VPLKIEKNTFEVCLAKDLFVPRGIDEKDIAADIVDLASDALDVALNPANEAIAC
jgi:hypothetical protein